MTNFKTILASFLFIALIAATMSSCKDKEDDPKIDPKDPIDNNDTTVTCKAFAKTMDENPTAGMLIGTLEGSTNKGTATFSLKDETPTGAFTIDAATGKLSVNDNSLYVKATNPTLTGNFEVKNGDKATSCTITITLKEKGTNTLPDCGQDPTYTKVFPNSGWIKLKTQASIDTFVASGWTEIPGDLYLDGRDITDISGLRSLTKIGGLYLYNIGTNITDLIGFCNVKELGGLSIKKCTGLTSLDGLERLAKCGPALVIGYNKNLEKIDALKNCIFTKYATPAGILAIQGNGSLTNLKGLENLTSVKTLEIEANTALLTLEGLENLTAIGQNATIKENPALTTLSSLKFKTVPGVLTIYDNDALLSADVSTLESARQIIITGNDGIVTLGGFDKLTLIGNKLNFYSNEKLKTISGFNALTKVTKSLSISQNQSLLSITGFTKLRDGCENLGIGECRKLNDMNGFSGLTKIKGLLGISYTDIGNLSWLSNLTSLGNATIRKNTKLTDFCGLKMALNNGFTGIWTVASNATNPTKAEVLANCP